MRTVDHVFAILIGLAVVAVVVSQGSQTPNAIMAGFSAVTTWITALMAPAIASQQAAARAAQPIPAAAAAVPSPFSTPALIGSQTKG